MFFKTPRHPNAAAHWLKKEPAGIVYVGEKLFTFLIPFSEKTKMF
jgi:hypothetical protein